jgi:hypothetical protein
MWLIYAASDQAIRTLLGCLPRSIWRASTRRRPCPASEMIEQIGKRAGQGVPAAARQMLAQFKP